MIASMARPARRLALAAALSIASMPVAATTWDTRTAGEYYDDAEIVARVRIVAGALLEGRKGPDGTPAQCSGRYEAKIVDQLKGDPVDAVTFFSGPGLALSREYLVFLSRQVRDNDMVSTNSVADAGRRAWLEACEGVVPDGLRSNEFARSEFYGAFDNEAQAMVNWVTPGFVTFPLGDFPERHEIRLAVEAFDRAPVLQRKAGGYMPWYQRFPVPFEVWGFDGGVLWRDYREYVLRSAKKDDGLKYPPPDASPNLVDVDRKTGRVVPKRNAAVYGP